MHQSSSEQSRIVAAVVAAAARLPKSQRRADHKRFLEAYYANVDAEDMAARDPPVLAGAALAHLGFAHRRMPLSLSFDHRCITGGEACRFLSAVIADLEKPD